jgi:hypothetical protein
MASLILGLYEDCCWLDKRIETVTTGSVASPCCLGGSDRDRRAPPIHLVGRGGGLDLLSFA